MTANIQVNSGSELEADIHKRIKELCELFADASEPGKEALGNVLRELTSELFASGLRTGNLDRGAAGAVAGIEESTATDFNRPHRSQRRRERPIAGLLVQAAQRHRGARFLKAHVPAGEEMTEFGAGVARRSRGTVGSRFPSRSDQVPARTDATSIVFVVDDDVAVRESLEMLIRSEGWHPEPFVSAQDFLSCPRPTVPCCLILDVNLPGLNSQELQKQLADWCDMPIVFVSSPADVPMSVQAMKAAGAFEFLTKPLQYDVLLKIVRDAIERSRDALRLDLELQALRACYESLTQREREVMALVVSGLLNKQAGVELGISEVTVKAHRGQVMRKMEAESLPDLVIMAARLGLRFVQEHSMKAAGMLTRTSLWPIHFPE